MKLEVQGASFSYPHASRPVFENIGFAIESGQVMTILGKNGVGKTTLVKCLTGVLPWRNAHVSVDGKELAGADKVKLISYVPQSHNLTYPYSVREIVLMGRARHMGALSMPSKEDCEATDKMIVDLGLDALANKRCDELSGGQLQMVFIARALVSDPEILVMDEPESALDFKNQFRLLQLVVSLAKTHSKAIIINTHYPDHALEISDTTLLMGEGKFTFGATEKILTENNMNDYFDVQSEIVSVQVNGKPHKAFVVFDA